MLYYNSKKYHHGWDVLYLSSNAFCNRKVLLVRHGRTDWNDVNRFQGRSDIPLNEEGLLQATKLAKRLESWPVDVVYTSPMSRARQTAEAIASQHGKEPVVLEGLTEVCFGSWEGQHLRSIRETNHDRLQKWLKDPFFSMPEGAETWDAIRARVERVVDVLFRTDYQRVVMVSHGGTMRALYVVLLGLDPHTVWSVKASNCAMSGVEIREHQSSLAFANDDLHLKGIPEGIRLPVW